MGAASSYHREQCKIMGKPYKKSKTGSKPPRLRPSQEFVGGRSMRRKKRNLLARQVAFDALSVTAQASFTRPGA